MSHIVRNMITKADILQKLSDLKPYLFEEYAVKKIGLFGSFADDTYTEESDIDILVELKHPIGWKFFTLEQYLQDVFHRKIDLVTPNALKEHTKDQIFSQVNFV